MKRLMGLLFCIMALTGLTACGNSGGDKADGGNAVEAGKILIAYFSCTDTTEGIARYIRTETDGTLYEILAQEPYTGDDLKYYTGGRADREQADPSARPAISGSVENMEKYDTVFLGYPIWHGQAPRIISTFLESYDFAGKRIIPFCTSHSSGIGSSDTVLHALAQNAEWLRGRRFAADSSLNAVAVWSGA